ncbi:UNVERIFIED_CONTAM: hypothetical protein FKN15_000949 [Acipenser sinensis]
MFQSRIGGKAIALTNQGGLDEEQVDNKANRNPFKVPPDQDIFLLRNKERERKKLEREQERNLKIHEKTTYAGRVNAKRTKIRDLMKEGKEEGAKGGSDDEQASWKLSMTKGCRIEKESINEFISRKRQMFLLQYSLAVKRDEMCKLDEMAIAEERKLEKAEQYLEEDATMFDAFLKENDKNSVEAIKIAELETKVKLEKVAEIKRISTKLMGLKRDHETDTLKQQVDMLQYTINRETERAAELELKARVFSFGQFKTEDQTGKKLVYRSQPPVIKQKEDKNQEITNREKEEQIYFFT